MLPGGDDTPKDLDVSEEPPQGRTVLLQDLPDGLTVSARSPAGPVGDLRRAETIAGHLPGDRYVRLTRNRDFHRVEPGYLVSRETDGSPGPGMGWLLARFRRLLLGRPLASAAEVEERVGRIIGLAIFASDNISSSAYATEEIMRVLADPGWRS